MRFSGACSCCDCTGGTTKICGRVSLSCSYRGQAGTVVSATGPDTLETTTDASGNYCFTITKKGTYTITAHGPCDTQSQEVAKPSCGTSTNGINFTFAGYNLQIQMLIDCFEEGNGARPYTSFGIPDAIPGFPAFPTLDPTVNLCVQPGDYVFRVWDNQCFVGQDVPITVGCGDIVFPVQLESKKYSVNIYVHSCTADGLDGVSVSLSGPAGSGSGTTDGNGECVISGIKQGCSYDISLSKERWKPVSYTGFFMNCGDSDQHRLNMEPQDGFTCFGLCCKYPAKLSIVDVLGTHPITIGFVGEPGGGGFTDCITTTKPAYPNAVDSGFFGILCKPDGAESDSTVAYKYRAVCQFNEAGGQWSVIRSVPSCMVRGIPPAPDTFHFAASFCDADGNPVASGTTAYLTDGGTQLSPSSSCGPFQLFFDDGLGLGAYQLISE